MGLRLVRIDLKTAKTLGITIPLSLLLRVDQVDCGFINRGELLRMEADAKRLPSAEASYRNLDLNQRVSQTLPFIAESDGAHAPDASTMRPSRKVPFTWH